MLPGLHLQVLSTSGPSWYLYIPIICPISNTLREHSCIQQITTLLWTHGLENWTVSQTRRLFTIFRSIGHCVVCVFSSRSFWTSSSLDVPAGVTQEEGHTGFLISTGVSANICPYSQCSHLNLWTVFPLKVGAQKVSERFRCAQINTYIDVRSNVRVLAQTNENRASG